MSLDVSDITKDYPTRSGSLSVLAGVSLEKDVDGFHPVNIGRLAMKGRQPLFAPCTPSGCMVLLEEGRVAAMGTPAEVLRAEVVARVFGWPVAITTWCDGAPQVVPLRPAEAAS